MHTVGRRYAFSDLDEGVVLSVLFEFLLDKFNHQSDHSDYGNNQRPKGQSAQMIPKGPGETSRQRGWRQIFLVKGPIPSSKGSSHDHLLHGWHKEKTPQKPEYIKNLKETQYCRLILEWAAFRRRLPTKALQQIKVKALVCSLEWELTRENPLKNH